MKAISLLAAAAMAVTALPAVAAKTKDAPAGEPAKAKPSNPASERICKRWMKTGTRLGPARMCATRAEWDDMLFEQRSIINQTQAQKRVIDGQLGRDAFQNCLRC